MPARWAGEPWDHASAPPIQVLDPTGLFTADPRFPIDLDDAALVRLHRDMTLIRQLDTTATALQQQGELGLWASSRGQEAIGVGLASALAPSDMAFPSYREHALAWCRGVGITGILGLFRGITNGGWDPQAVGLAVPAIVIGAQVLHAVGYAMGQQLDGCGDVTAVVFGDGASSQGDTLEAMVWAASFQAPVILLCINNGWAISVPATRQSRVPLAQRARGFGFPGLRVDGNDVLAVHAVAHAALTHARAGGGPVLIEAVTYRMAAHTTADDDMRYRTRAEVDQWQERDPISRLRAHLIECGLLDEEGLAELQQESRRLAESVRQEVRAMPMPDVRTLGQHAYASDHLQPLLADRSVRPAPTAAEADLPPRAPALSAVHG